MLLRDPVHGLIAFEGDHGRLILELLDTREVQRLRRIRQLGLASLVFPGAEHSRFSHALGATFVMQRWLKRIKEVEQGLELGHRLDASAERDAMAAALLHDLGHGPMSHLFEEVMPTAEAATPHETWTQKIIEDPDSDVHRVLCRWDHEMPSRVSQLVRGQHRLSYLGTAVSGVMDVDRCDYLLRDSHMTGVRYGLYDLDWLIRSFCFVYLEPHATPALAVEGRKGLPPVESFFLARHFMYAQVYHHKATRAAECLIRSLFIAVKAHLLAGDVIEGLPSAVKALCLGHCPSTQDYLGLDDHVFWSMVGHWARSAHTDLSLMSQQLLARHLPKTIPLPDQPLHREHWFECHRRACEIAQAQHLNPAQTVWLDIAEDKPFADEDNARLWVRLRHHAPQTLGTVSFVLEQLRNKTVFRPRLIVPETLRERVGNAIDDVFRT